jgi:uncharacterized protein (TIGR03083 family)
LDHVADTRPQATDARSPQQTRRAWRDATDTTLEAVTHADPDADVAVYGLRLSVSALLIVRAFELWIHENDIRRAVGLPPSVPDLSTLRLMTALATRLLPGAVTGHDSGGWGCDLHLVLTGGGGGTWDMALRPQASERTRVDIVTDAVDFCRLVANRIAPDDLVAHVDGDGRSARRILTAVATLALD